MMAGGREAVECGRMDEPPKKRRFWQLHLSTLMILSVEASLLVLLNISKSDHYSL